MLSTYPYRYVERVLARLFGIEDDYVREVTLRARIDNYKKLGLSGEQPGKGFRIAYNEDQVRKFALALMLSEAGLLPEAVVTMLSRQWEDPLTHSVAIADEMAKAAGGRVVKRGKPEDAVLTVRAVKMMTGRWQGPSPAVPRATVQGLSEIETQFKWDTQRGNPIVILINLTDLAKRLNAAFEAEWKRECAEREAAQAAMQAEREAAQAVANAKAARGVRKIKAKAKASERVRRPV
jgi:hypothetical protein